MAQCCPFSKHGASGCAPHVSRAPLRSGTASPLLLFAYLSSPGVAASGSRRGPSAASRLVRTGQRGPSPVTAKPPVRTTCQSLSARYGLDVRGRTASAKVGRHHKSAGVLARCASAVTAVACSLNAPVRWSSPRKPFLAHDVQHRDVLDNPLPAHAALQKRRDCLYIHTQVMPYRPRLRKHVSVKREHHRDTA